MSAPPTQEPAQVRVRVRVRGIVQGVGYRPFVHHLAADLGLVGTVGNDAEGVLAEAQGAPDAIEAFVARLAADAPAGAVVEAVEATQLVTREAEAGFAITASRDGHADQVALVPADTAVCPACLADAADPSNRRYRYPFTACTYCGPRFTMTTGLPYDREHTTMAAFPLCPACAVEYSDPADRRFHAQPTACPACGPQLRFVAPHADAAAAGDAGLAAALDVLGGGGIVAVRGLGGYHLAVDARDTAAVARLRARKQRGAKPFAVMAADLATAQALVDLTPAARAALTGPAAPIVLAPVAATAAAATLAAACAPGAGTLGVLLPYTVLHHLLLAAHPLRGGRVSDVLVMTSGNLADEPLCTDPDEAEQRLAGIADAFLHHTRPVHTPCDDSVVAAVGEDLLPVRRSRGFAPVPVRLPMAAPPLLAVGAELKTTACLAVGHRAFLSQHVGDTENLATLQMLDRVTTLLAELCRVEPELVVADRHPGYLSRAWAQRRATATGARLVLVGHHHAHLASLLAEHAVPADEPVLGLCFDGTGYGDDGTIWGGEALLGSYAGYTRLGHLAPVSLPGGDAAVRRPARAALAYLHAAGVTADTRLPAVAACPPVERTAVASLLRSGSHCVPTTSMGRLFDAVSALAGVCQDADYEGQAAVELEALAAAQPTGAPTPPGWAFGVREEAGALVLDPGPLVAAVARAVLDDTPVARVAAGFHAAVADGCAALAGFAADAHGVRTVGLTGGVFQNTRLTGLVRRRLQGHGFVVLTHHRVPPNDGGLALGQAAVAAALEGRSPCV